MAEHGIVLELYYDGAWNRAPVLTRFPVKYRRGTTSFGNATDPASGSATLDNASGNYAPLSVLSGLYGKIGQNTPVRLTADASVRMTGEASWKPKRPVKGSAYTPIDIAGVLSRLGRGADPLRSPLARANLALTPVSYWPLEADGGALTAGTAPLVAGSGRTITWADSDVVPGSLPLPRLATRDEVLPQGSGWPFPTALSGAANATSATAWTVSAWVVAVPHSSAPGTASVTYALQWGGIPAGASERGWELSIASGTGWTGASEVFVNMGTRNYALRGVGEIMDGAPHHLAVTAEQTSANNITIKLYVDGVAYTAGSNPNPATPFTLTPVGSIYVGGETETSGSPGQWMGHVAVFDRALSASEIGKIYAAGLGYSGETAADRFSRLCLEEGITATVVGTAADSVAMGRQRVVSLLDQFDEIAATDDAAIFETRSALGLTMRTGASKLNQAPALHVSYLGQITPDLEPVFGAVGIRNDVTARNPDGANRRVVQATGPRNVQQPTADPQGVGRYTSSLDVNVATATMLSDAAGWRVNLGTYDGTWYAEVTVDLDAAAGLTSVVNAVDIGDVVELSELPVEESIATVRGLVIGIEEDLPPKRRLVTFHVVPAAPYGPGKLSQTTGETDVFSGRLETDGSTTSATSAAGAASFTVTVPSGPLWTTVADDFPLDVVVGGQRVTLSGISGSSSPQTFTVKTAPNDYPVQYPIASGARVTVYQPIILTQ